MSPKGIVEEAMLCESSGLDGVMVPDYQAPFSEWCELTVALTSIALNTTKILLGSFVTDFQRRHPVTIAHTFASLTHIAGGRVILGLGAGGGPSHTPFGIEIKNPVERLREGIEVIRNLWKTTKERKLEYQGKFFKLKDAGPPLRPAYKIPIYIGAHGPKMLKLTAELADGWIPESHTPETYAATLKKIREMMKDKEDREFEPCCGLIFYPWEPDNKTYERLLKAAKNYLAMYPDIQWEAGEGKEHPGLRTHKLTQDKNLLKTLAEKVPDWLAEKTIIYGEKEECIDKIEKYQEAGCQHIILEPYWIERNKIKEAITKLGKILKETRQPTKK